ncbi:MAG: glycosyltransferase family 39 protein [Pirellula sp.]|jgi:4-amino-4-deoxy-L-arabinose transferase-like glycosyltransferase|nr:glycosyltransferase family 39 protein [Pirellula sp.]
MDKVWLKPIALILTLALAIRICGAIYWQSNVPDGPSCFRFGDSDTYWVHAQRIAAAEPYRYLSDESRIFRSPLFPIFLSPFAYLSSGSGLNEIEGMVLIVRIIGAFLGTVTVGLVWCLAKRIGGERAADGAALCAALYPGAIGMSIFVLSEMLFCPLMLGSLLCTSIALDSQQQFFGGHRSVRCQAWILLAGFFTGLACLARPSWGLWAGLWWLYLATKLLANRESKPVLSAMVSGFVFIVGITVAMGPWWIRNYQITRKFVPSTLQVGASLYDGWHAGATGSSDEGMAFVERFVQEQLAEDRELKARGISLESTMEWRLDRRMRNAAIEWVRENPSDAIRLGMVKFWKTWRPLPVAQELGGRAVRYAEGLAYVAIMGFGALGMWCSRCRTGAWLFALPSVYFAVLHMAFIGSVRYRQPAVLVMCVLAGCGIVFVLERMKLVQQTDMEK